MYLNRFGYPHEIGDRLVLFVHGAGMDSTVWTLQARQQAATGTAVIAPDLPGHGRSAGSALGSIAGMAETMRDLLSSLGPRHAVIVGHSMGALVALVTASLLGSRCAGLALVSAGMPMPVHPDLIATAREDLPTASALIGDWAFRAGIDGRKQSVPGSAETWHARRLLERSAPGVLAADLDACAAFETIPAITCPSMLAVGSDDRMTRPKAARKLADAIGAEMVELPGVGHMPMLEAPVLLRRLLTDRATAWLCRAG